MHWVDHSQFTEEMLRLKKLDQESHNKLLAVNPDPSASNLLCSLALHGLYSHNQWLFGEDIFSGKVLGAYSTFVREKTNFEIYLISYLEN